MDKNLLLDLATVVLMAMFLIETVNVVPEMIAYYKYCIELHKKRKEVKKTRRAKDLL